ncbi:glycoside hydrolase family 65 protein [Mastigocoleus sp. MO_188.B34]|uniref:glycoside hydrolase family 65 protein n=1 Tax=Mastigocoleus sp. MO_188.B34 TaxID=3036635 RepID=UPI002628D063|nr:glycoside hydrolase family 65 protein [Mastigocoleus sp. MO_188.B34]MDJ0694883.1 glycoside hydrolase family 65 protein [Mastigocoleus sp. MO_188.B34]
MLHLAAHNSGQAHNLTDSKGTHVIERGFDPQKLHHQETVFNLSNGYLGTRGTFEEGYPRDSPATMIHGVYDDVEIAKTELVNCPNWLALTITIDEQRFGMESGEILTYERGLDLRLGVLSRNVRWRSPKGQTVEFNFERFVSLADCHTLAIRCQITSIDFEGEVKITSGFNAEPTTQRRPHWKTIERGSKDSVMWLHTQTKSSQIQLGMAAKLTTQDDEFVISSTDSEVEAKCYCLPGQTFGIEKVVTVFTSRDTEIPLDIALDRLAENPSYPSLLAAHIAAWDLLWKDNDVIIEGDTLAQLSVRYNIFQLLAVAPRNDDRVSIPPKTLSGFGYRGHIFWDTEIFILPLLVLTQPALARNLLNYRYHNLPQARLKAQEMGFEGAMFAWESADTGEEVTPRWVPDPNGKMVRIWCGDLEIHINSDIAYAAWQYWKITGDDEWMGSYGAEMFLDTANFWESRVEWNETRNCYDIRDVIGPDENHDRVDNNAFTNLMVRWHLKSAITLWEWLSQGYPETASHLANTLKISPEKLQNWAEIAEQIFINIDSSTGLIEQFDGFFDLEYINFADYESRKTSMQGLLGVEETSKKQILKQPDVLMVLYLLRDLYDKQTLQANWDYYTPRTDHSYGSSLGPAINAIVACDLKQPETAYDHFMQAALVDLVNVRLNANDGVHAASAGGVWQAVIFGFGGIRMTESGPVACAKLPANWKRLQFKLKWRDQWHEFDLRLELACNNDETTEVFQASA